jgi:hypothetical protein
MGSPEAAHAQRGRRQLLDGCLWLLEGASEAGEQCVSAQLASRTAAIVPAITIGIRIRDAIDFVFQEQERATSARLVEAPNRDAAHPEILGRDEAKELTERIKKGFHETTLLMLEAHRRGAWRALGYPSWERYARQEFGFSRSRSYQLLDHGRVLQTLMTSAKLSTAPDVSAYAAAQILPRLEEVVTAVERSLSPGMEESDVRKCVCSVVDTYRAKPVRLQAPGSAPAAHSMNQPSRHRIDDAKSFAFEPNRSAEKMSLTFIIEQLLELPSAADLLRSIPESELVSFSRVVDAAARLTAIATEWKRHYQRYSPSSDVSPNVPGPYAGQR